jgi:hypothetical protein
MKMEFCTNILLEKGYVNSINDLKKEIEIFKDKIKYSNVLGEINPSSEIINLRQVSHKINNVDLINESIIIDIEILNTPNGKILNELKNHNLKIFPRIF